MAVVKAVASAVAGGTATLACCRAAAFPIYLQAPAVLLGSFASLIYYVRVWIQGFYFDKRCTTDANLEGRVAVVTGGTVGGLGFAAAEILARLGAKVVVTVRSDAKGEESVAKLKLSTGNPRCSYIIVDFLSKASVRHGAAAISSAHSRLDMLVLNAGVGSGPAADLWMSNVVGPFLFTEILTPLLTHTAKVHGDVRVVSVSSGAHKKAAINFSQPYESPENGPFSGPYGQSKLAQIMHMRELQRRLRAAAPDSQLAAETSLRCISVTPGFALTNIAAGKIPTPVLPLVWLLARSPHTAAHVIKMACVDPNVPGGSYLSNCGVKASEGADGCSNQREVWRALWELLEKCGEDARYP
ncbi:hypothetical protein T484DRAFT_1828425 [Baffinella frigidus]|nr:hypothetical protein T484DRAFT_1828425 [Cryptophyta sp. CCMP2293]